MCERREPVQGTRVPIATTGASRRLLTTTALVSPGLRRCLQSNTSALPFDVLGTLEPVRRVGASVSWPARVDLAEAPGLAPSVGSAENLDERGSSGRSISAGAVNVRVGRFRGRCRHSANAERLLDAVKADLALARGQVVHARFLETASQTTWPTDVPTELALFHCAIGSLGVWGRSRRG